MYFNRAIAPILLEALKQFPVCILTGARQVGKSTLLKNHLKKHKISNGERNRKCL